MPSASVSSALHPHTPAHTVTSHSSPVYTCARLLRTWIRHKRIVWTLDRDRRPWRRCYQPRKRENRDRTRRVCGSIPGVGGSERETLPNSPPVTVVLHAAPECDTTYACAQHHNTRTHTNTTTNTRHLTTPSRDARARGRAALAAPPAHRHRRVDRCCR
jgi:hypothetical protein